VSDVASWHSREAHGAFDFIRGAFDFVRGAFDFARGAFDFARGASRDVTVALGFVASASRVGR